jgi:hypothetical protein
MQEYAVTERNRISFNWLPPIQKIQVIESIFKETPDTDIGDLFWLKAQTARSWRDMPTHSPPRMWNMQSGVAIGRIFSSTDSPVHSGASTSVIASSEPQIGLSGQTSGGRG